MTIMHAPSTILIETRGPIEILSLNRPELNLVNPTMIKDLTTYFTGLHQRPEVRVVILRSNGRAFCGGAELGSEAFAAGGSGRAQRQMAQQKHYSNVVRLMRSCPQPIIALLQGAACGAGFSLALASDVRFAAPEARLNAAYIRVGLGGCDMGSGYLLPRLVGLSAASEILLSGRFIGAERAKAIGLVSDIFPANRLLEAGLELAGDMLRAAPMGLRLTKETLNLTIDAPSLDAGLTLEDRQQVMLSETEDHREAVAAFRERRAPRYIDQ
jgi:enoyl-CoA hydratase/carnithine racemase